MATADGAALAAAVRRAVEEAEAELASMPFFVRPMVRRGFASRTGRSFDEWTALLARVAAAPDPAAAARLAPGLAGALAQLEDNFRTAPERAKKGMGGDAAALRVVEARAEARVAATRALIEWLRGDAPLR